MARTAHPAAPPPPASPTFAVRLPPIGRRRTSARNDSEARGKRGIYLQGRSGSGPSRREKGPPAAAEVLIPASEMRNPSAPSRQQELSGGEIRPPSGLGVTCSRQEVTADAPGNDGGGPLERRLVQVGSGGGRRVRPGGNADGGRNWEMRLIGCSAVPGPLLLRFTSDLCGGVQPFHAYFILRGAAVAAVATPGGTGPARWDAASVFGFSFGSSSMK